MESNPQSPYSKFPHDFILTCIGTWNDETAHVYTDSADHVAKLEELITKKE